MAKLSILKRKFSTRVLPLWGLPGESVVNAEKKNQYGIEISYKIRRERAFDCGGTNN